MKPADLGACLSNVIRSQILSIEVFEVGNQLLETVLSVVNLSCQARFEGLQRHYWLEPLCNRELVNLFLQRVTFAVSYLDLDLFFLEASLFVRSNDEGHGDC